MSFLKFKNRVNKAYDGILEPWDYPEPIIKMHVQTRPTYDGYLRELIYMAEYGWYYCQEAMLKMSLIHPLTDYRPVITDEYRKKFDKRLEDHNPIRLAIYERDGKFIMGEDWEAYWLYREREEFYAHCVLIGHFNVVPGLTITDRPYMIGPHKSGKYGSVHDKRKILAEALAIS